MNLKFLFLGNPHLYTPELTTAKFSGGTRSSSSLGIAGGGRYSGFGAGAGAAGADGACVVVVAVADEFGSARGVYAGCAVVMPDVGVDEDGEALA
jgi:hypothetical protein